VDREEILREAAEENLLRESHQRKFLYADVENLINTGFLHHPVFPGDNSIVFRTLLPPDADRFWARSMHSRKNGDSLSVLRWSLASSVWMVNGVEIPLGTPNGAFYVYDNWAKDLSENLVAALYTTIIGLRNRIERASRVVEAYCYEPYSRANWRMLGKHFTRLQDANIILRMWVAYNISEDQQQEDDRGWAQTQAIVGSLSNKSGKFLRKSLDQFKEKEKNRQQRVIEDTVNWILYGDEGKKPLIVRVNGQDMEVPKIHSAQTVQDLEEEMRKIFSGEKDYHDTLVEDYHEGIRQRTEQQRATRRKMILEARKRQEEAEVNETPQMVGYTREQLETLNPGVARQRTTSSVPESAQTSYMYDRYFKPAKLKPGVLTPSLQVEDAEPPPKEEGDAVELRGLQQRIAQRRPTFKGG